MESKTYIPGYGEVRVIGDKLYIICVDCGKLVQINKPIFGDLHICAEED